jgi:hypothetical protein
VGESLLCYLRGLIENLVTHHKVVDAVLLSTAGALMMEERRIGVAIL